MTEDLNPSMFRAYDIRTPAALLPDELAVRLAKAESVYFRDVLGVEGVLVAHDARRTGPHYLTLATDVFLDAGLNVTVMPGVSSTCLFYFTAMRHPESAAVMFGASHNPKDHTGQKILGPGVQPIARAIGPEGGLDCLENFYRKGETARSRERGRVYVTDSLADYVSFSLSLAGVKPGELRGLRILQDYLHGAAGREMMLAFQRAGADLTPLHFAADGEFPLGDPNPVKTAVTRQGRDRLGSGDFHLGMFFDGDGDRLDVYLGPGTYLASSFVYAAVLPFIKDRFPGEGWGVFAGLKSNPVAVREMVRTGVRVEVIRNGHSQIKQALKDDPTLFGAVEESAHFYEAFTFAGRETRYCTENTLYLALLVSRAATERPERLAEMAALQAQTAREREWGYKFPSDESRRQALEAVEAHFVTRGATAHKEMNNGLDLEATMLRRGLPFVITASTDFDEDWLQLCQRISQSETGLARWEAVASSAAAVRAAKARVARIVKEYGAGTEYQG